VLEAMIMDDPRSQILHARRMLLPLGMLCAAGLSIGCAGTTSAPPPSSAQRLTPMDFASSSDEAPASAPETNDASRAPSRVISAREARGGDPDVLALVGRPADLSGPMPTRPVSGPAPSAGGNPAVGGEEVSGSQAALPFVSPEREVAASNNGIFVDEMVGQINGRPVYAAEFLRTLDDALRAEAIERPPGEWVQFAGRLIQNQLLERIRDELLIAEFNAGLSYDERIGLFAFIDQIQQGIVDRDLGSAARADERLRTSENVSLRGKAQEQFNREVVFEQLRREVTRKVQVSWRDIRRYYEQNISIFQPPASARLRVLRVPDADRDRVSPLLEQRSQLAETIERETTFRRQEGGVIELELGPDGLAGAEFFGPAALNDPATRLEVGQLSEPIEFSNAVWWLYLEEVVQPETVSLYDAQNRIEQLIRSEREQDERSRYFERLFGSSTMTEQQLMEMRDRLMQFAIERYLAPEDRPTRG
ncbi:MAG: peptidyl-prolyl cis-trans isomerase, partial [Phycisphaerales bacterium]